MAFLITCIFSILVIIFTVYNLIKLFTLAHKKELITRARLMMYVATTIVVGFIVASILPLFYIKLVDMLS